MRIPCIHWDALAIIERPLICWFMVYESVLQRVMSKNKRRRNHLHAILHLWILWQSLQQSPFSLESRQESIRKIPNPVSSKGFSTRGGSINTLTGHTQNQSRHQVAPSPSQNCKGNIITSQERYFQRQSEYSPTKNYLTWTWQKHQITMLLPLYYKTTPKPQEDITDWAWTINSTSFHNRKNTKHQHFNFTTNFQR